MHQCLGIFPTPALLHFVHDEDEIGPGLINDLGEGLCQGGTTLRPEFGQIEIELESVNRHFSTDHPFQCGPDGRGRILELAQLDPYGSQDEL